MSGNVYRGEIYGGGEDGNAEVLVVMQNPYGIKSVHFLSIEANKKFTIRKSFFRRRFPERVN